MRTRLAVILVAVIAAPQSLWCKQQEADSGPQGFVEQVWNIVNQKFLDPTYNHYDPGQIRDQFLSVTYTNTTQAHVAARSMLQLLGDPQTRFLEPEHLASTIQEFTGEAGGIGVADPWILAGRNSSELKILHVIAESQHSKRVCVQRM